jgi:hypothetical protein
LSFSEGPLVTGILGGNLKVQRSNASCSTSVCCCLDGSSPSDADTCEMNKLSADQDRGDETPQFGCSLRPSSCDPTRSISVPTVFRDVLPPLPPTQGSSFPEDLEFFQTAIPIGLTGHEVLVFHPPCV